MDLPRKLRAWLEPSAGVQPWWPWAEDLPGKPPFNMAESWQNHGIIMAESS
jgi:hypothetical protein